MPVEVARQQSMPACGDRLYAGDRFGFRCGADRDCFQKCCCDVTIVLTPYDILRLKRALRLSSSEFLDSHALVTPLPGNQFPVVVLRMDGEEHQCPFLNGSGCSVYAHRPWACRMYPLGYAEPRTRTAEERPFHFVIHEDLCHGHDAGEQRSVRDWIAEQGIEEFEAMNASFKDLTLHEFWDRNEPLTEPQADMFTMACYDVDCFRRFVFETRFLEKIDVDEERVEAIRNDDLDLLDFGIAWLRFALFHEKTMKIRAGDGGGR